MLSLLVENARLVDVVAKCEFYLKPVVRDKPRENPRAERPVVRSFEQRKYLFEHPLHDDRLILSDLQRRIQLAQRSAIRRREFRGRDDADDQFPTCGDPR